MPTAKPRKLDILGTRVDVLSLAQGLEQASQMMTSGPSRYITLPYVEFVMRARSDDLVRSALDSSNLTLPNGVALNWAASYLYGGGKRSLAQLVLSGLQIIFKPQRVHNVLSDRFDSSNFTWQLLSQAAIRNQSVFLIGSPKRQSIEAVAAYLAGAIPKLQIAGSFTGHLDKGKEADLIVKLKSTKPDLILVGMGFPRQELLMQRLARQLDHGLMIGEGGSFDYVQYGGHIKRAPAWVQRSGLEWLWRLIREPSRLRRQLVIPVFIWLVYLEGRKLNLQH